MPVQFQGATEYQRKFKAGQLARCRSASPPHGRCRLAGLRSDQLAISREPQFLSKRKIPSQKPLVSRSLCWHPTSTSPQRRTLTSASPQRRTLTSASPQRRVETSDLPQRPAPTSAERHPHPASITGPSSPDRPPTPLASRDPRAPEPTAASLARPTPPPCALINQSQSSRPPLAVVEGQQALGDGVQQVLRRKAGLRSWGQKAGLHQTEYDRQFPWKTPVARSPLLHAEQMHSSSKAIPPFKSNPAAPETEYRGSFKGSPPPRAPRSRHDPEHCEVPLVQQENVSPKEAAKKSKRKKKEKKNGEESGKSRLLEGPRQELRSHSPKKAVLPQEGQRKVKSEYDSNFRSPLNYRYKDGAWVKSCTAGEEACNNDHCHIWYHEVRELRERAEAYRRRAWGTHFSRQHLNQILSEQTLLWEPSPPSTPSDPPTTSPSPTIQALDLARVGSSSSAAPSVVNSAPSEKGPPATPPAPQDAPALPVQRALAWGEEGGVNGEGEEAEEREEAEEESEDDVASDSLSSREGRLPTPQLKFRPVQRTHHDLTTPATGGAILVSPPRQRKVCGWVRRNEPPLGKPHSPYKHLGPPSHRDTHQAEGWTPHCTSPIAGVITVDPLPMREEAWSGESPRPEPLPTSKPVSRKPRPSQPHPSIPPPANAIQGMLRNPEFQHNGDLGPRRSDLLLYSPVGPGDSDEDDRLSVMSWRSAASCSMASAVLERAQKRREDFWGKR